MYTPINTYTKKDIIWYLKTFNNGRRSYDGEMCRYKDGNNHCAVGCFIPHGHKGMECVGTVGKLLFDYPDLKKEMPLSLDALRELQNVHDTHPNGSDPNRSVLDVMLQWVEDNVEENK